MLVFTTESLRMFFYVSENVMERIPSEIDLSVRELNPFLNQMQPLYRSL